MLHWFTTTVANTLQKFYEAHRVPETWGTPTVSCYVFQVLRNKGFSAAAKDLFQRLQEVGKPNLSTFEKCTVLLLGVIMVGLADSFLKKEMKPTIVKQETRQFSQHAPKIPVMLYTLGAALLVAANDGGRGYEDGSDSDRSGEYTRNADGSFSLHYAGSEESTEYRAYHRPDEGDGGRDIYDTDAFDEWGSTDDPPSGRN
jgi:hypothetical protein